MYALVTLIWLAASVGLAYGFAKMFTYYQKGIVVRTLLFLVFLLVIFFAPLADEIIGKRQFDRLCEAANQVKIYGTIPVGEELYTPEGKWRLDLPSSDFGLGKVVDSYFLSKNDGLKIVNGSAITIYFRDEKMYEKDSGVLLEEWRVYSTSGGWLSRQLETPFLVHPSCEPDSIKGWGIYKNVLRFEKSTAQKK